MVDLATLRKKAALAPSDEHEMISRADIESLIQEIESHQFELAVRSSELRQTQAEHEALRERYYDLYMDAPVGYVIVDIDGQIDDVNMRACQLLGEERKYVVHQSLAKYFDDQSRARFFELLKTIFDSDQPQHAELKLRSPHADNAPIYVTVAAQTFMDNQRHLARLTLTNISEQVAMQHQLEESEYFAHSIVDALAAHIAILDEHGAIMAVNNAWQSFATENGVSLTKVGPGINYLDVLQAVDPTSTDWETAQAVLAGMRQVMSGDIQSFSREYPCHAAEQKRWFVVRVTRFAGNGPLRLVVAHEDITQRVLIEQRLVDDNNQLEELVAERTQQLQRLNHRMNTVLSNVSNPVLLVHENGHIDITNPAFDRKLGYEPDELFGQSMWGIFDEAHHPALLAAFEAARNREDLQPVEARLIAKDGTTFDAEVSLNGVPGNGGHMVCTLYDISHLKEMDRLKDDFISMVSHELRTPVTSMMLGSSALERYYDRLTEEQKLRKLSQITQQAQILTELVTSILDISRFVAHQGQRSADNVDVVQTLRDVVSELSGQVEAKQQQLDVEIVNGITCIHGERFDLVRVWRNLLSNAIKYTAEGGSITARLYGARTSGHYRRPDLSAFGDRIPADLDSGRYIIGIVEDNGHGIRPQDLPQLFTRFFRGWAAGTNITGTGLGLSLVRDLLQLYGGDIAVNSELGVGTTFCFWLTADETGEKE